LGAVPLELCAILLLSAVKAHRSRATQGRSGPTASQPLEAQGGQDTGKSAGSRLRTQLLRGEHTQGDEDGEDQQFLHGRGD
jgi:hypothetical protein